MIDIDTSDGENAPSESAVSETPLWRLIAEYAAERVRSMQRSYLAGLPAAKADLAALRNGDPTHDENVLIAWESIFSNPPERILGHADTPNRAERAIAAALHLYAVHQQSKQDRMHVAGCGLGTAIRQLANPADAEANERPVMRRYHALNTANDFPEVVHHLRGLVSQFRSHDIALDYAQLATDLYFLSDPTRRTKVRLAWARDLSRKPKADAPAVTGAVSAA